MVTTVGIANGRRIAAESVDLTIHLNFRHPTIVTFVYLLPIIMSLPLILLLPLSFLALRNLPLPPTSFSISCTNSVFTA